MLSHILKCVLQPGLIWVGCINQQYSPPPHTSQPSSTSSLSRADNQFAFSAFQSLNSSLQMVEAVCWQHLRLWMQHDHMCDYTGGRAVKHHPPPTPRHQSMPFQPDTDFPDHQITLWAQATKNTLNSATKVLRKIRPRVRRHQSM